MDLETRPLRCFVAVAETRSFTKAAELLHVAQPTLSTQIRELEKHLGFALFERTTRKTDLTREGQVFLEHARRMIAEGERLNAAIKTLRAESTRRLTVGAAFYTIDIPERVALIERFMGAHPEIILDIDNRWQAELVADVQKGRLDLALIIGMAIARRDYEAATQGTNSSEILYPDDMHRLVLRRERVELLVPVESPLAQHKVIPLSALRGSRISIFTPDHGAQIYQPISETLRNAGAELVIPPEGNGIGVERYGRQFRIPAVTLGWFPDYKGSGDGMVRRPLEGVELWTDLALIASPREMPPAARTFWSFTAAEMRGSSIDAA